MISRIEKILSLLKAEGIKETDKERAIKSLSETVAPTSNIRIYLSWLGEKNK